MSPACSVQWAGLMSPACSVQWAGLTSPACSVQCLECSISPNKEVFLLFFFLSFFFCLFLSRVSRTLVQSSHKIGTHSNPTVKLYSLNCLIYSINDLKKV